MKKVLGVVLSMVLLISLTACSGGDVEEAAGTGSEAKSVEKTEIKLYTNGPDRSAGGGLLEEMNIAAFEEAYPEYEVVVEALADDPYKQKLKAYMASNDMPDMWQQWAQSSDLSPMVSGGYVEELDINDYADYKFVPGALDAFTVDGKLYGLPKNTDYWILYYNEAIFEEYGLEVPETTDDLIEVAGVLNKAGIIPMTYPGKEKWASVAMVHNLALRYTGDSELIKNSVVNGNITDEAGIASGVAELMRLAEAGVLPIDFNTADYGSAKNLFAQGQSAMYAMGSWEMGLASDTNIPEEMRNSFRATAFPVVAGEAGKSTEVVMWFGGGYSISKGSNKEAAKVMLDYIMQPSVYAKNAWETQTVLPPQDFSEYVTGSENQLQKDLVDILASATQTSGSLYCDLRDAEFKVTAEELTQKVLGEMITVDEYIEALNEAAK